MLKESPTQPTKAAETANFNFRLWNNLLAWLAFGISTVIYLLTVERTASFWDCGEFIACSYKLQVPHPPGAPFFLLMGRMFSLFAPDVQSVAYTINLLSVLASGFTILFLFWTITRMAVRCFPGRSFDTLSTFHAVSILGAGFVGSLSYAFTDSFWFSAVEAEVYAASSFFTAFVVWAMLRWEQVEDESLANRWILLIAYMMGLSIGVHLLNLVVLPAMALIYYYKRCRVAGKLPDIWGVLLTLAVSGAGVLFISDGVIPGLPSMAGNLEIFLVNNLGMPFGSGAVVFVIGFLGVLVYGIIYTIRHAQVTANTALLAFSFILIGYLAYGIVLVRAFYNPPINENDPSDIIKFVSYLKREQYGSRPLLYGPHFKSEVARNELGAPIRVNKGNLYRMVKEKGRYEIFDKREEYVYNDNMLLPRIYSRQDNHVELYLEKIYGADRVEELMQNESFRPSFGDNLWFLFTYQFNYMYWRYFGWNFVGRESDREGAGVYTPFNTEKVPDEIANNKGRNQYYFLPFLLGVAGMVFMFFRSQQTFLVTLMLFLLTGLALVVYLNSPPVEPRERDYIYVGSFYAFAIWIGFGVLFLAEEMRRFLGNAASVIASGLGLIVPAILLAQNYDDHDRSNRYHSVDSAKNLLNSCAPNAILFTGGDNDTFPLWYAQEVEGFRTDVRVCNLSLLGTDWYIDQMKRPAYKSAALPISIPQDRYLPGRNDQILYPKAWQIQPNLSAEEMDALEKRGMDLKVYLSLVSKNDPKVQAVLPGNSDEKISILPARKLKYFFDRNRVKQLGLVPADRDSLLKDHIEWELKSNDIGKAELMMLDLIASSNWERPIYFSTTLGPSNYLGLKEYMQMEGLAYRLMPYKMPKATEGFVNTEVMFNNLTKNFFYRELDNPKVYYDENYERFTLNLRSSFSRLCEQLIREGKKDKAREAVLFCLQRIPDKVIPYDVYTPFLIDILFEVGEAKRAMEIVNLLRNRAEENLAYYIENDRKYKYSVAENYRMLAQLAQILEEQGKQKEAKEIQAILERLGGRLR